MRSLVLLLLALAATACGGTKAADARPESTAVTLAPSDVATAKMADLVDAVAVSGSLDPQQSVIVKSQIVGTVRGIRADRGTSVRRGQVLASLDADEIRERAASAKAAVASGQAAVALALQRLESARRLHEAGGISDIDLRSAEAASEAAAAQLAAARALAAGAAEAAAHQTVRAPIDGIVSSRTVEEGEAVKDAVELFRVVDTRTLELKAQVGVDEASKVRVGAPVEFTIDAAPDHKLRGHVARVDPVADPTTRRVGVYSQLPNPDRKIVAGQFARGRVIAGTPKSWVAIPTSALHDSAGTAYVYAIEDGKLARRNLTLGDRDDAQHLVGVASGLKLGDRVLAVPVTGAAEGLSVTVAGDVSVAQPATPASAAPQPKKSGTK
jgi:RND family efflux transporter MFP subunit